MALTDIAFHHAGLNNASLLEEKLTKFAARKYPEGWLVQYSFSRGQHKWHLLYKC